MRLRKVLRDDRGRMTRQVFCPCGAPLRRLDSRRTRMPRILRIRLYNCEDGHQLETAETIVGEVVPIRRKKLLINTHSFRKDDGVLRRDDYRE